MRINDFTAFIVARENHRIAKEKGWSAVKAKPDPIISEYRFCNVRRNDDRVTKWIHDNIMHPLADSDRLWFALVIARLFNSPSTLGAFPMVDYERWNAEKWRKKLKNLREHGTIFNAAYIVSTNGRSMDKVDYIIDLVLTPLWKARTMMAETINGTKELGMVHGMLMQAQGLGSFMAAQVVADLKYASPKSRWKDFDTFVASGPGSRRGLNRVLGGPLKQNLPESTFREKLLQLRIATNERIKGHGMKPLTAQDIQNCLCEFDKYERARLGEGKPKQKYTPAKLPWKEG